MKKYNIETLQKVNEILFHTVKFYADKDTYKKMSFTFYNDCGDFYDDFIKDKPGKLANEALKEIDRLKEKNEK